MIDRYDWAGGTEAMLRFGPDTGPVVVLALPLFEEANRTRSFAVTMLRALAGHGIASVLPDLPGQGESLVPLCDMTILRIQEAYEGVVDRFDRDGRPCFGVGIRSGALLDALGLLFGRWHFAPQDGPGLLRDLTRIKAVETGKPLGDLWFFDRVEDGAEPPPPVEIAGNMMSPDLLTELSVKTLFDASPGIAHRIVRLESDPADADRKIDGAPLWRRSEPGNDPVLAELLARDIAEWIASCDR